MPSEVAGIRDEHMEGEHRREHRRGTQEGAQEGSTGGEHRKAAEEE